MARATAWGCRLAALVLLLAISSAHVAEAWTYTNLDYYASTNRDDYIGMDDTHPSAGGTSAVGQSFTADYTGYVLRVRYFLQTPGTPDGNLVAALYTHSGTYGSSSVPTGSPLAISNTVAANTLTGGYVLINFDFTGANRHVVTAGQHYCIAVYRTATADSVSVGTDQSTPSHDGNAFKYTAGAWGAVATEDVIFYVSTYTFGSGDGTYSFPVNEAVYENNTDAGETIVSAVLPSGTEEFPTGSDVLFNATSLPTSFYWSIGAATRVICVVGEETITVTLPDDDYSSYGLTVRDYTGKLGLGTAYLESYRSIGGEDILTQRAKITVGSATPMTLVVYKLYHLQVLWADGTRYDAGYYTPGVDTTTDIYVFGVSFTDQAQVTYKYLTIEALRPSPTQITVNYQDTLNQTTWCNVTIMTMDRTTVHQAQGSGGTLQFNWLSAEAGVDYTVYVVVDHSFFDWYPSGEWVLQGAYTFPAFIPMVGSVGGISVTSIVGWFMVAVSATAFSKRDAELGLWAGVITASLMWMVAGWFGAAELGIVASFAVVYTILKRSGVL